MAIANGINIACSDLQASGGIRSVHIRTWSTNDSVTYSNSSSNHSITSIANNSSTATWYNFEFKNELPSFTSTASKENGSTMFENTLSFMMPEMDNNKGHVIQELLDTCMMALAVGNNGKIYVLGISQKYSNEKATLRNQTYASMTSLEGTSGAAYNDDSGWTVTLTCKQWEAPRLYVPSGAGLVLLPGTGTSTTT